MAMPQSYPPSSTTLSEEQDQISGVAHSWGWEKTKDQLQSDQYLLPVFCSVCHNSKLYPLKAVKQNQNIMNEKYN